MGVKKLVETIKHNGILASAGELQKLFTKSVEAEEKNIELQKNLTDLAVQLANAESKCRELVAENAGMKNALEWLYATVSSESASIPDEKYSSVTNAAQVLSETTATDAFLAEVRAQGVEIFGDYLNGLGWDELDIKQVRELASQLRKGAAL